MKVRVLSFKNSCACAVDARVMAAAAVMIVNKILILLIIALSLKLITSFLVRNRSHWFAPIILDFFALWEDVRAIGSPTRTKLLVRYRPVFCSRNHTINIAEKVGGGGGKLLFQQLLHPFDDLRGLNHNIFRYRL